MMKNPFSGIPPSAEEKPNKTETHTSFSQCSQLSTMNPNSNNKDSKTSTTSTTTVRKLNWFLPFWKAYFWSNFRVTAMSNLLGFYTLDHKSISHIVITMKLRKKLPKKSLKKTKSQATPTNSTACHGNSNAVAWQLLWRKIR